VQNCWLAGGGICEKNGGFHCARSGLVRGANLMEHKASDAASLAKVITVRRVSERRGEGLKVFCFVESPNWLL
jgi:hypothetical protein